MILEKLLGGVEEIAIVCITNRKQGPGKKKDEFQVNCVTPHDSVSAKMMCGHKHDLDCISSCIRKSTQMAVALVVQEHVPASISLHAVHFSGSEVMQSSQRDIHSS